MNEQKEIFDIKVTKIKNRWHARLIRIEDKKVIDEMACNNREDIRFICYTMLRWADKMGWNSPMAHAARERQKVNQQPKGKIWYQNKLRGSN